jgi:hypothetical protein
MGMSDERRRNAAFFDSAILSNRALWRRSAVFQSDAETTAVCSLHLKPLLQFQDLWISSCLLETPPILVGQGESETDKLKSFR